MNVIQSQWDDDDEILLERTTPLDKDIRAAQRPNIWLSLGKAIFQGFCKPKRNDLKEEADDDESSEVNLPGDELSSPRLSTITTLVSRPPSYANSAQSILEIWVAACVLIGWTIRVLQYKDPSFALTTAVAPQF